MNLQTKIPVVSQQPKINYESEIVLLGSCFSENIGEQLAYYKFKTLINPFGILFHPKAIETFLWMATQQELYTETDVFQFNERWHCFDAHSKMSKSNRAEVLEALNNALLYTHQAIQSATHVFITLGTAWVYRLMAMDMVVANCHKVPQKEFSKELLGIEEIRQCLENCVHFIRSLNPAAKVVFTVSPVRHAKDGLIANSQSKSHLIAAVHQVVAASDAAEYFPSYELMMDELRDYRFYEADMLHPTDLAVSYIWEYFIKTWVGDEALKTMATVEEIQKGMAHRPFNPASEQHQSFLQKLEVKKEELTQQYAYMRF